MSQMSGLFARKWTGFLALCLALPMTAQLEAWTDAYEASPVNCASIGPVKAIQIKSKQDGTLERTAFCTFARNGAPLDATYFSGDGQYGRSTQHFSYSYDAGGQPTEMDIFDNEDLKHPTRHVFSKRNAQGRVTETEDFDPDGTLSQRTVFEFSNRGDIVEERRYLNTERIEGTTIRRFDSRHHVLREETHDFSTGRATETNYLYNARGQELKKHFRSEENSALYLSTYDTNGRLRAFQTIVENPQPPDMPSTYGLCNDCGEFSGTAIYRYDEKDRPIEVQAIQPPNRLVKLIRYAYDGHGYRTKDWTYQVDVQPKTPPSLQVSVDGRPVFFSRTNRLPLTTYRYDARGNWVKAVITEIDSAGARRHIKQKLTRKITYY